MGAILAGSAQDGRRAVDFSSVTDNRMEAAAREEAFAALLTNHPEAVVAAIAGDGMRVAMPDSVGLAGERVLPLPLDRASLLDAVVPADAMAVITAFERAVTAGAAVTTVHSRQDPERALGLTFIDLRHLHGVLVGVLTAAENAANQAAAAPLSGSLAIPLRPRTAIMRKSWNAMITEVDERVTRMLGWTAAQLVGARTLEFLHPDDHERAVANWMEMMSKQQSQRVRLRHRCADGGWLWVEVENIYHAAENPEHITVVSQLSDISDEMAAHDALDRREKLFRRLAESLPIGLLQLDRDGSVAYANARLADLLGPGEDDLADRLGAVAAADRPALDAALAGVLERGRDAELEVAVRAPGGGERRCAATLIALSDDDGAPGALVCLADITDSARMREELQAKATYDQLTGCHNRASTMAALEHALSRGDAGLTAVVFVDLDRFKPVNDRLGHAAGDELLVRTADRLRALVRAGDVVGRLGGDEFLLVCSGLSGPAEAQALAGRVREALHRPVTLAAGTVPVGASIGVACAEPGATADTLIARADAAMYTSKRGGHGEPVLAEAA